jgi:hypothetical protein
MATMETWVLIIFFATNGSSASGITSIPDLTKEQCERMRADYLARAPKELRVRMTGDASAMCVNKGE